MLTLRLATMDDAQRLFDWRNDPVTRANSRNPEPVAWEHHCNWLGQVIDDPARRLLIIEVDGSPAATMRFDYGSVVEANFTIAPEHRCCGLSLRMMKLGLDAGPPSEFWIMQHNTACQRLAAACGAELLEDGRMQHWRYRSAEKRAA